MYGDGLFILRYLVPFPVGLPTLGDDLNEDFTLRDFRGLRDALEVGLDVQLDQLALFRFGVLRELQVDAGIGYGLLIGASGELDTDTRLLFVGQRRGSGGGGERGEANRIREERCGKSERKP